MNQWIVLYQKELLFRWRNKQFLWFPLVLTLLALVDPLTYYYLPEIIELSGGLPEGAVFEVASLEAHEAVRLGLDQLSLLGSLIVLALAMGTIAGERQKGIAEIMFTKPIRPLHYITAKWASLATMNLIGLFIALFLNWYYTSILYGELSFTLFIQLYIFYSLWFLSLLALNMVWSAFSSKPGVVFGLSALVLFLSFLIQTAFGHRLPYFPLQLNDHLEALLQTETVSKELALTSGILASSCLIFLTSATLIFRYKRL